MKTLIPLLLTLLLCGCAASPVESDEQIQWADYSAMAIIEKLNAGEVTSVKLVNYYLERINKYDQAGPKINSILALNPNALADASRLDAERIAGSLRGPLHGVPVLLKDNIETEELPTTAGSLALRNNNTQRDAPIVSKLRNAGAIILGKTNLSEWANFRSEDSVSGWSGIAGLTLNPHDVSRSACGSSSGSGAAIAMRLAPLAVGTETNGSVICPASMNGIVGFKPTVGLLSRTNIVPISPTQDTAGPMTNSVADAALMINVMAGTDASDTATQEADSHIPALSQIMQNRLDGVRIGVMRNAQGERKLIIDLFDAALAELVELGAELVEITEMDSTDGFGEASYNVLLSEFHFAIDEYLAAAAPQVKHRDLESLIEFNNNSARELAIFDQAIFEKSLAAAGLNSDEYRSNLALVRTATREKGIDQILEQHNVSILVAPSYNPAFKIDTVYGDHGPWGWLGIGWMAAIAGYPHVTVPMGTAKHLPVGISFISSQWQDSAVLQAGYAYEQKTHLLTKPKLLTDPNWQQRPKALLPITD